jgi:hypothetical protein
MNKLFLSIMLIVLMSACLSPLGEQAFRSSQRSREESVPNAPNAPLLTQDREQHYTLPLCVLQDNTVYLRNTPNVEEYPLGVLQQGDRVYPNGGVMDNWMQVSSPLGNGWVNAQYVGTCVSSLESAPNGLYDRSTWELR